MTFKPSSAKFRMSTPLGRRINLKVNVEKQKSNADP